MSTPETPIESTENPPWHEDDAFWRTFAPVMFGPARWDASPTEIDQVVGLLEVEPGARVLDLCCGPGRHSIELARRGFRVTGVDRTTDYLNEARKRADEEGLEIEFVEDDMREFCRPEAFDAVVNLFTAFGYFDDPAEDRRVIENVYCSLKPGGALIMDLIGKEIIARIFQARDWHRLDDGALMLEDRSVTRNWSWCENCWTLIKDGKERAFRFGHRIYSAAELTTLLSGCGFGSIVCFGNLAGAPYDHAAQRLIVVARKPEREGETP